MIIFPLIQRNQVTGYLTISWR